MKVSSTFLLSVAGLVVLLSGCYTNKLTEPVQPKKPTDRVFSVSYDSTWQAVIKVMAVFPLTVIEKESGILNTDWTTRTAYKKVSVWRGLIFGGQVDDEIPMELMERFNVLVTRGSDSTTTVRVIRFVKARPYDMIAGPKGSWTPASNRDFTQTESSTVPEWRLLNAIDQCLSTGKFTVGDLDHAE